MATREEYAKLSKEERLARIAETPDELRRAVNGCTAEALARRPDPKDWAPIEVICHVRDNEHWFLFRLQQIMLVDEPRFITVSPDHEAEERGYLVNDARAAIRDFAHWRKETLQFFGRTEPSAWDRAGVHTESGTRRTIDEYLTIIAWHDGTHVEQLRRAIQGLV